MDTVGSDTGMAQLTELITRNNEFGFFATNLFGGQTAEVTRLVVRARNLEARSHATPAADLHHAPTNVPANDCGCSSGTRPCGNFPRGSSTVTWTATDAYGDTSTTTSTVTDTTPPSITAPPDIEVPTFNGAA